MVLLEAVYSRVIMIRSLVKTMIKQNWREGGEFAVRIVMAIVLGGSIGLLLVKFFEQL